MFLASIFHNFSAAPKFLENLTDGVVSKGEKVSLTCKLDGFPKPSIHWTKDGLDLPIKDLDNEHLMMIVENAASEDIGVYTVTATNVGGEAVSSCSLKVQGKSSLMNLAEDSQYLK